MIIITGAAGFIGSCMTAYLNEQGYYDLALVDDFKNPEKAPNFRTKKFTHMVDRKAFFHWAEGKEREIEAVIHLGARTDTYETDTQLFNRLNLHYSQQMWQFCTREQIPLIYASSAATYGDGVQGFSDDPVGLVLLKPLNAYAESKHHFDLWALAQEEKPYFWAGFKFFNVYGPNEYHKKKMASVIFHFYHQIQESGKVRLFKSYHPDYADGMQKRDFIYVKDVVQVLFHFLKNRQNPGLYNLGAGKAETFNYLATNLFQILNLEPKIEYVDLDESHRPKYQYFTEADLSRIRQAGCEVAFRPLSEGIEDYVNNYLKEEKHW